MKRAVVLMLAVASCGCATYVPVEVKTAIPEPPPECEQPLEKARAMRPFPRSESELLALCPGVTHAAVCINAMWARHAVEVQAVDRRNRQRHAICGVYVGALKRG